MSVKDIVSARLFPELVSRLSDDAACLALTGYNGLHPEDWAALEEDNHRSLQWQFYNGTYKSCGRGCGDFFLALDQQGSLLGGAGYYCMNTRYVLVMSRFYVIDPQQAETVAASLLTKMTDMNMGRGRRLIIGAREANFALFPKPLMSWSHFQESGTMQINHVQQPVYELDIRHI